MCSYAEYYFCFFPESFRAEESFWINYLDVILDFVVFYSRLEKKYEFTLIALML